MMNEKHFNIGDIVRIPVSRIEGRIKYISQVSSQVSLIPFSEIVYSEDDPLNQYVKARIIEYNDEKKKTKAMIYVY